VAAQGLSLTIFTTLKSLSSLLSPLDSRIRIQGFGHGLNDFYALFD
jgi:hypothetical protein